MVDSYKFMFICAGNADSIRNAFIPFARDIGRGLTVLDTKELAKRYSINEVFNIKRGPTADAGSLTTIAVGIVAFLGGWAGNKFLDEVYEAKIRPRIKRWLSKLDDGVASNPKESPKQLQVGIWYEDRKVLVLVVVEAASYKEMIDAEPLVAHTHERAANWIEMNGVLSPVHVHVIKDGNVNPVPLTFQTVEEFSLKARKKRTLGISSSRPSPRSGD